jgi:hypothetical protein
MTDLLFGSAAPIWSAVPSPPFGWPQTAMPTGLPGNRPLAVQPGISPGGQGAPIPSTSDTYGFSGVMPSHAAWNVGAGFPLVVSGPFGAVQLPAFNAPEMGASIGPALVASVALRRGQPLGPGSDQDIEDFIADALDLLPGASEVEVRCEAGRATLTGSVPHKRVKRDVGEIAWAIPGINDVQNNVTITPRRRSRTPMRESESLPVSAGPGRKQT